MEEVKLSKPDPQDQSEDNEKANLLLATLQKMLHVPRNNVLMTEDNKYALTRIGNFARDPVWKFLIHETETNKSDNDTFILKIGGATISVITRKDKTRGVEWKASDGTVVLTELDFFEVLDGGCMETFRATCHEVKIFVEYANMQAEDEDDDDSGLDILVPAANMYAWCGKGKAADNNEEYGHVIKTTVENGTDLLASIVYRGRLLGVHATTQFDPDVAAKIANVYKFQPGDYVDILVPRVDLMYIAMNTDTMFGTYTECESNDIYVFERDEKCKVAHAVMKVHETLKAIQAKETYDASQGMVTIRIRYNERERNDYDSDDDNYDNSAECLDWDMRWNEPDMTNKLLGIRRIGYYPLHPVKKLYVYEDIHMRGKQDPNDIFVVHVNDILTSKVTRAEGTRTVEHPVTKAPLTEIMFGDSENAWAIERVCVEIKRSDNEAVFVDAVDIFASFGEVTTESDLFVLYEVYKDKAGTPHTRKVFRYSGLSVPYDEQTKDAVIQAVDLENEESVKIEVPRFDLEYLIYHWRSYVHDSMRCGCCTINNFTASNKHSLLYFLSSILDRRQELIDAGTYDSSFASGAATITLTLDENIKEKKRAREAKRRLASHKLQIAKAMMPVYTRSIHRMYWHAVDAVAYACSFIPDEFLPSFLRR